MSRLPLLCFLLLLLLGSTSAASIRVDSLLTMSDGVQLSVTWLVPSSPAPKQGYPAVVMVHSFEAYSSGKNQYISDLSLAPLYADSGYFAFAYTVRGQGVDAVLSGGEFTWFTGDREMEDLREILAWLDSRSDLNGSRIAVEGLSQGGFTAWGAATRGLPVRCIVPTIANAKYTRTFLLNGAYNYLGQSLFMGAKYGEGFLIRLAPFFGDSLYTAFVNDRYDRVLQLLSQVEMEQDIPRVTVPVFIQGAWQDEINSSPEVLSTFLALRSPRKILLWPGAHAWPASRFAAVRTAETLRFYRYWLKDDTAGSVMNESESIGLFDAASGIRYNFRISDSSRLLPRLQSQPAPLRFYLAGSGELSPELPSADVEESRFYLQGVSDHAIVFRSAPFDTAVTLIAATAHLVTSAERRTWQANTLLWDYDPTTGRRTPLMRGSWQARGLDSGRATAEYDLSSQLHTIAAGHLIEAWVKFGTSTQNQFVGVPIKPAEEFGPAGYPPQETGQVTLFSTARQPSYIDLYTIALPEIIVITQAPRPELSLEILGNVVADGGIAMVRVNLPGSGGVAGLYDMQGRRLWNVSLPVEPGVFDIQVECAGMAAGRYILRVQQGESFAEGQILVVN